VKGDVFQGEDSPAVIETNLTASEIRETSTVLADDPFRAIQTLPGVSASGNNDFYAQFSVMGEPSRTPAPTSTAFSCRNHFNGLTNISEGATLSIMTSESIEDIKLLPVAYPEKFGDAVGAALDLPHATVAGQVPSFARPSDSQTPNCWEKESWVPAAGAHGWQSARKSYLGYLLRNRLNDNYVDVSFYDAALKLTYDLRPNQTITFYGVGGHTFANLLTPQNGGDPNSFKRGTNDFIMARTGWRWTVNPRFLLDTPRRLPASPG